MSANVKTGATLPPPPPHEVLEIDFRRYLKDPRRSACGSNVPKTCRTEARHGEAEIRVIKEIKKFTAYFYSALFVDRDQLEKAEVHVPHSWCG